MYPPEREIILSEDYAKKHMTTIRGSATVLEMHDGSYLYLPSGTDRRRCIRRHNGQNYYKWELPVKDKLTLTLF